jgi:hypothetical protein
MMTVGFICELDQRIFKLSFSSHMTEIEFFIPHDWDGDTEIDDHTSQCVLDKWGNGSTCGLEVSGVTASQERVETAVTI